MKDRVVRISLMVLVTAKGIILESTSSEEEASSLLGRGKKTILIGHTFPEGKRRLVRAMVNNRGTANYRDAFRAITGDGSARLMVATDYPRSSAA